MDPAFEEEARKRLGRGWEEAGKRLGRGSEETTKRLGKAEKEARKRLTSDFGANLGKPFGSALCPPAMKDVSGCFSFPPMGAEW
jgi:hypothetical protein